jgi:hypothetical protein
VGIHPDLAVVVPLVKCRDDWVVGHFATSGPNAGSVGPFLLWHIDDSLDPLFTGGSLKAEKRASSVTRPIDDGGTQRRVPSSQ